MKKLTWLLAGLMVVALALPASAQQVEVKTGVKAWTQAGTITTTKVKSGTAGLATYGEYTVSDMGVALSGLSRINFTVLIDGKARGFVELRPVAAGSNIVQAYGTADFAGGTILAGVAESNFDFTWGRTAYTGTPLLIGWGKAHGGRIAQLCYSRKIDPVGVKVGLVSPSDLNVDLGTEHPTLPTVEAEVSYKLDKHTIKASLCYAGTKTGKDTTVVADQDKETSAYGVAVVGDVVIDPAKITVNVFTGKNLAFARGTADYKAKYASPDGVAASKVLDTTGLGLYVDAEVKATKDITVTAGYGMDSGKYADLKETLKTSANGDKTKTALFAAVNYKVSPNMTLSLGYNARKVDVKYYSTTQAKTVTECGGDTDSGINLFATVSF